MNVKTFIDRPIFAAVISVMTLLVGLIGLVQLPVEQWQGRVKNDFEPHIFEAHPTIASLKQMLLSAGAVYASMSGSGSALFGLFREQPKIDVDSNIFIHIEQL